MASQAAAGILDPQVLFEQAPELQGAKDGIGDPANYGNFLKPFVVFGNVVFPPCRRIDSENLAPFIRKKQLEKGASLL